MKKIIAIIVLSALFFNAYSQKISGTVTDGKEPLPGAGIIILKTKYATVSDSAGKFIIDNIKEGSYQIKVSYLGRISIEKEIKIGNSDVKMDFVLETDDVFSEEIIITGTKAGNNTPVAFTNIEKSDIEKINFGQDIPYILNMTPSVVVTSDAGVGIGYTSMRIRGTDLTRINVTLDGIPLNDSESHGVWWVNMPDFASSSDMIQIQRGVGTSTNGAGAFGANVGFYTDKINSKPYAQASFDYGSFNSQKYTLKSGTGLINNHFSFEGRVSKIHSDGYVDRASSNLESMQLSGSYINKKTKITLNILHGKEKTYQAWYGIPKDSLNSVTGRTYNPYTYDNETDNYSQNHYQLFIKQNFSTHLSFNLALHYTKGAGYYEQYKEDQSFGDYGISDLIVGADTISETNLIRQKWLDNDFYGGIYSLYFKKNNLDLTLGGAINNYTGNHFGNVIWTQFASNSEINHEYYRNKGTKTDINEFIKMNYEIFPKLSIWTDFQYRLTNYAISGIHDDLIDISQEHPNNFFNPKAGLNYYPNDKGNFYFSFSTANREPSRSDYRDAVANRMPTPETLYDYEAGYNFSNSKATIHANAYYMNYKDQLVLTGEINDVGAAIMVNVPESYRMGIELDGGLKFLDFIEWKANVTLSKNKILNFTSYVDDWDTWPVQREEFYESTDISFSPAVTAASELSFSILKNLNISFNGKYVGKQFIDNTSSDERSLHPYLVNNFRINYSFKTKSIKKIDIHLALNNIFNQQYETNAWVYRYYYGNEHYVMDGYFPQAGFNFFAGISFYISE